MKSNFCINCGTSLVANSKFCTNCGKLVSLDGISSKNKVEVSFSESTNLQISQTIRFKRKYLIPVLLILLSLGVITVFGITLPSNTVPKQKAITFEASYNEGYEFGKLNLINPGVTCGSLYEVDVYNSNKQYDYTSWMNGCNKAEIAIP